MFFWLKQILEWLSDDPFMKSLMPESERGGLCEHLLGDRWVVYKGGMTVSLARLLWVKHEMVLM